MWFNESKAVNNAFHKTNQGSIVKYKHYQDAKEQQCHEEVVENEDRIYMTKKIPKLLEGITNANCRSMELKHNKIPNTSDAERNAYSGDLILRDFLS